MCEDVVRDKINRAVNDDSQTDGQRNRIEQRTLGENYQRNRDERETGGKQIIEFKPAVSRLVMRSVNAPQNAVKQPAMGDVGKDFKRDETGGDQREKLQYIKFSSCEIQVLILTRNYANRQSN